MMHQGLFSVGTDTNNAWPIFERGQYPNFYVGRLGGEVSVGLEDWDTNAATHLLFENVFAYWDLSGPAESMDTPAGWGSAQAMAFGDALPHYRCNRTVGFFDIESGNSGWGPHVNANRALLVAALRTLRDHRVTPGVYIAPWYWQQIFGSRTWSPGVPFVLWIAGTSCPRTAAEAVAQWHTLASVGGMNPVLWQYRVSPGCCDETQDLNVSPYGDLLHHHTWLPRPLHPDARPC